MTDKKMTKAYMALTVLADILQKQGFQTQLFAQSDEIEIDTLIAAVTPEAAEADRFINFAFLPVNDSELKEIKMLQFYYAYPYKVDPRLRNDVSILLADFNNAIPIGSLGIDESETVFYRYVHILEKHKMLPEAPTRELVSLFLYVTGLFDDQIRAASEGMTIPDTPSMPEQ